MGRVLAVLVVAATVAVALDRDRRTDLLVAVLQSNDEEQRYAAARSLVELGPAVAPAVAKLLDDPWPEYRATACFCLGELGPASLPFVERLAALARKDDFPDVRREALEALAKVDSAKAAPLLRAALDDQLDDVRRGAEWAVRHLAAGDLVALLDHPRESVRERAILALEEADPPPVDQVATRLAHRDRHARIAAAILLECWGEKSVPALDAILAACASSDAEVAATAIRALAAVEPTAAAAEAGVRALRRPEAQVRESGALLLMRLGESARPAAAALVRALADPEPGVRHTAVIALGELRAKEAADDVAALLGDPEPRVRVAAAKALWQVTGEAGPALATLREILRSRDRPAREPAIDVAREMGVAAKPAMADLVAVARQAGRDSWEPILCARAIAAFGDPGKAWEIAVAAHDPDEDDPPWIELPASFLARELAVGGTRADLAARLLATLGAEAALPVAGMLADERREVRLRAAGLLLRLGEDARAAVPALLGALADADADVRREAANALRGTAERTDAARKGLSEALGRERDPEARLALAAALWEAGGDRGKILPLLLAALADESTAHDASRGLEEFLEADPGVASLLAPHLGRPSIRVALAEILLEDAPELAQPVLRAAIERGDTVDLWSVKWAGDVGVPVLRAALASRSADVRSNAVSAMMSHLAFGGPESHPLEAEAFARDWAPLLSDPSAEVRSEVLRALEKLGPLAAPAVPALVKLLDGPDRREGARVLYCIGRSAKPAAPRLAHLLREDADPRVRLAASHALAGMGKEAGEHARAIGEAARTDADEAVRHGALHDLRRVSIERGNYATGLGGAR